MNNMYNNTMTIRCCFLFILESPNRSCFTVR